MDSRKPIENELLPNWRGEEILVVAEEDWLCTRMGRQGVLRKSVSPSSVIVQVLGVSRRPLKK